MPRPVVFSIIESPVHPDFSGVFRALELEELRFASMRKAIAALKRHAPRFAVAEFFYGYGNNYAGVNISNLDVFLYSLQKYAPDARMIVMVAKAEIEHVSKLCAIFPVHAVLAHPVTADDLRRVITD